MNAVRVIYDRHRSRDITGLTWIRLVGEPIPSQPEVSDAIERGRLPGVIIVAGPFDLQYDEPLCQGL